MYLLVFHMSNLLPYMVAPGLWLFLHALGCGPAFGMALYIGTQNQGQHFRVVVSWNLARFTSSVYRELLSVGLLGTVVASQQLSRIACSFSRLMTWLVTIRSITQGVCQRKYVHSPIWLCVHSHCPHLGFTFVIKCSILLTVHADWCYRCMLSHSHTGPHPGRPLLLPSCVGFPKPASF